MTVRFTFMPFRNPNGIESISPGLRDTSYPGWAKIKNTTPTGLHQAGRGRRCNPFRVEDVCFTVSQGSSCLATLGWMIQSFGPFLRFLQAKLLGCRAAGGTRGW